MITWKIIGDTPQAPAVIEGYTLGNVIAERFAIDWQLPPAPEHPTWQVKIGNVAVKAEGKSSDGIDELLKIEGVAHTDVTVLFDGTLYSFARRIQLQANCSAVMMAPNGVAQPLSPISYFTVPLILEVVPGPARSNPIWSRAVGTELREAFRGIRAQTFANAPLILRFGSAEWIAPMTEADIKSVKIEATDKCAICNHSHATTDLLPDVTWILLEDGSGIEMWPSNCQPYERYRIIVDRGTAKTIVHLRTQ